VGRADARSGAQKSLFDANSDAASKKENYEYRRKKVADANSIAKEKSFARSRRGIAVAIRIAKEKESFTDAGGRISIGNCVAEKEKGSFADAGRNRFTAPKEKAFANT
jgi:hypothetical protein